MDTKNVQGALQPILDFFNSLHLTDTGMRWAHDILDGLVKAWNHDKGLRDAVKAVLKDAGKEAARAFKASFSAELHDIDWRGLALWVAHQLDFSAMLGRLARRAWPEIKSAATSAFHSIANTASNIAGNIGSSIQNHVGAAWDWVKSKAQRIWSLITSIFSNPFDLHFHIPGFGGINAGPIHIPGWGGVNLATGGIVTGGTAGRDSVPAMLTPGEIVLNKKQQLSLLHGGGGGLTVTVNAPNARILDQAFVRDLSRELNRLQARHA